MVDDYLGVYHAIQKFTSTQVEGFVSWDTELESLLIETRSGSNSYNDSEASKLLDVTPQKIRNFLVVHCFLSNHIDKFSGVTSGYKSWNVIEDRLVVSFNDGTKLNHSPKDICDLMRSTDSGGWSYEALLNFSNSIEPK